MIEEEGLHPITCLTSLSNQDKKILLGARVVLCSDVKDNPNLLKKLLGENFETSPVINEINEL